MSEVQELPAGWLCRPDELEQQLQSWAAEYGEAVKIDWQEQLGGLKVYAVTVGQGPRAMLTAVPQNNNPKTPAAAQREFALAALVGSIMYLGEQGGQK